MKQTPEPISEKNAALALVAGAGVIVALVMVVWRALLP